jgi:hypothetical protein
MKSEIIINPKGDTLTILEGKALDPKHPEKIKLSGNIESISQYLKKRYNGSKGKGLQEVDKEKAIVIVDADKMNIVLLLDADNPFGTSITATLELTKELKEFHINENHEMSREQIIQILKFAKRFFSDPIKHEEMIRAYMKLNLSGTTSVKKESDDRGNSDLAFKRTIDSQNIPTEFVLFMPIFKGQGAEKFRVEVCLSVTDASVRFWFESVELTELIEKRRDEIFKKELESAIDFVVIHK